MDIHNKLQKTIEATLAADLAAAGTLVVTYPAGFLENHFSPVGHKFSVKNGGDYVQGDNFAIAFGLTAATVTFGAGETTIPAGSTVFVELSVKGNRDDVDLTTVISRASGQSLNYRQLVEINLGAPIATDPNGYVVSQDLTALGVFSVSVTAAAALAAAALAGSADVPRNVVAAWTTTAVLTITGTDVDGNVMVESSGSGTTLAGKKAFKTITDISSSVDITGLTVGSGDVLGLPIFLPNSVFIIKEMEDGAAPTAGTTVAGVLTKATATTGDVRGTYDPNSACDGAANFSLLVALDNPEYLGITNYAG